MQRHRIGDAKFATSSRVYQGSSGRGDRRVSPGVYFHCGHDADLDCDLIGKGKGHDAR